MYGIYSDMQQRNEPTGLLQICQLSVIGVFEGGITGSITPPLSRINIHYYYKNLKMDNKYSETPSWPHRRYHCALIHVN